MNPFKAIGDIKIPFTGHKGAAVPTSPNLRSLAGNSGSTIDTSKPATPWHAPNVFIAVPLASKSNGAVATSIVPLTHEYSNITTLVQSLQSSQPAAVSVAHPAVQETQMATVPVSQPNGFISWLKKAGTVALKVLGIASALQNTPAVRALESITIGPALSTMITNWLNKIVLAEATGAQALASAPSVDTNAQKAALVIAALENDAQAAAAELGASAPTQADLKIINDALVTILNVFKVPAA